MMSFLYRLGKMMLKISIGLAGIAILISYARLSEFGDLRKELLETVQNSYPGRIRVDGEVSLDLSFPPQISMENVRIRNSDWGTQPDMLRADRVVAELDLLPLIQGRMALPRLNMFGVDIIVETRDGTTNWDELNEFETAAGPANPATIPVTIPQIGGATVSMAGTTLNVVGAPGQNTVVSLGDAAVNVGSDGHLVPCP